jgi:hypothetical protein
LNVPVGNTDNLTAKSPKCAGLGRLTEFKSRCLVAISPEFTLNFQRFVKPQETLEMLIEQRNGIDNPRMRISLPSNRNGKKRKRSKTPHQEQET